MASGALGGVGSGTTCAYLPGDGGVRVVVAVIGGLAAGTVTTSGYSVAHYSTGRRWLSDQQSPHHPWNDMASVSIRLVSLCKKS